MSPRCRARVVVGCRGRWPPRRRGGRRPRDAAGSRPAEAAVQDGRQPLVVPGVAVDARRPPSARRSRSRPQAALARSSSSPATHRTTRSCSSTTASRSSAPATSPRPRRRSARRRRRGRDTYYEMRADEILHPQFFTAGRRIRSSSRRAPTRCCAQGVAAAAPGPPALRRAGVRAGRAAPPGRRRGAGRGRGRALRQGQPHRIVLAARAARRALPAEPVVRYHLGLLLAWTGQREQAVKRVPAARSLGPQTTLGKAGRRRSSRACAEWD